MKRAEFNAVLAGLQLLESFIRTGTQLPDDVLETLTDGVPERIRLQELGALAEAINTEYVTSLHIEDDA
jgi:hypothetical protein